MVFDPVSRTCVSPDQVPACITTAGPSTTTGPYGNIVKTLDYRRQNFDHCDIPDVF